MTPLPTLFGSDTRTTDGDAYSTSSSVENATVACVLVDAGGFVAVGDEVEGMVDSSGAAVAAGSCERPLQAALNRSTDAAMPDNRTVGRLVMAIPPPGYL
jgi:hypothetical protein